MDAHNVLAGGRLTVDLGALVANWKRLAELASPAECGAVVKADAYGCGIEPVVGALSDAGCDTFFVALAAEGARVKRVAPDAACFVLNGLMPGAAPFLRETGLIPVLNSVAEVEEWCESGVDVDVDAAATATARSMSEDAAAGPCPSARESHAEGRECKLLPCALQVDTGMTRLGMTRVELEGVIATPRLFDRIDVRLLMTHFACADTVGHPKTGAQQKAFEEASALLPGVPRSAANSAANLQQPTLALTYDVTRPGIALYGGEAINGVPNSMQRVVTLEARIMMIRSAKAGDTVGYGATETLERDSRIAYVSVGYADGYPRAASNTGVPMSEVAADPRAAAVFGKHLVKGVGRISMDMCAFDVTDIPDAEVKRGDWIELFGKNMPLDDVARASGTIGYELLTGMSHRLHRVYLK